MLLKGKLDSVSVGIWNCNSHACSQQGIILPILASGIWGTANQQRTEKNVHSGTFVLDVKNHKWYHSITRTVQARIILHIITHIIIYIIIIVCPQRGASC